MCQMVGQSEVIYMSSSFQKLMYDIKSVKLVVVFFSVTKTGLQFCL